MAKGRSAGKPSTSKATSPQAALKQLLTAQSKSQIARAKAEQADAQAQLVRAKISAAGMQVVWDPKTGAEKVIKR